jgi:hypothetical protein
MTDILSTRETLFELVGAVLGSDGAAPALSLLDIDSRLRGSGAQVSRAQAAMALNICLYARLLERVPSARRYAARIRASGERVSFDHGALRTVDGPTGALPRGIAAFARILEPLGYRAAGRYPLPRLRMTGRAFVHADLPETIPQLFVSELHVADLPEHARNAAQRVFGASRDPLGAEERAALAALDSQGTCPLDLAAAALPGLVATFERQHDIPALADYETLLDVSAETAWISTEGNAFNHATDRVRDVEALARELAADGFAMKPAVEHSANGRVHQTAILADPVMRQFRLTDGSLKTRSVPGSFYEFITRERDPQTGALDLTFDSGNATGIFAVTSAR